MAKKNSGTPYIFALFSADWILVFANIIITGEACCSTQLSVSKAIRGIHLVHQRWASTVATTAQYIFGKESNFRCVCSSVSTTT